MLFAVAQDSIFVSSAAVGAVVPQIRDASASVSQSTLNADS